MSFNNNSRPERMPGIINGNPANGLCERVALQVTKVFDAGIAQQHMDNVAVTVGNVVPDTPPTEPLTFLSARSLSSTGVVTDLDVTPLPEGMARVKCNIVIPIEVLFSDSTTTTFSGTGTVTVPQDVVMRVPGESLIPYEVMASVNLVSSEGSWTADDLFSVSCCVTTILKVAMDVEMLLPTYGYAFIPPAQNYKEEVCDGVFDMPLYPVNNCRR